MEKDDKKYVKKMGIKSMFCGPSFGGHKSLARGREKIAKSSFLQTAVCERKKEKTRNKKK